MNVAPPASSTLLRPALARHVDRVCTEFEIAWKDGGRPRIEDFLSDTAEPERSALLHELVLLDVHYRRVQGEMPTAGEYEVRFPAEAAGIRRAFAVEPSAVGPAETEPDGSDSESGQVSAHPLPTSIPSPLGTAGRNELFEEIGHGGMGRVLRGRDCDLGRDLAVKVLREEHRDDPILRRRFVEEARVGGQLQHPGIVPIYELGAFPDKRPYFTMKLVQGRTLTNLLEERPHPCARAGTHADDLRAGVPCSGVRAQQGCDPPRPETGERHGGCFR